MKNLETPEKFETPENSMELEMDNSRREFLKKLGRFSLLLGLGSFQTVLEGCASFDRGLKTEVIDKELRKFNTEINDPHDFLKYLEAREFIIADEVFTAYANPIDKRPKWLGEPLGGYSPRNYLNTEEEKKELETRLNDMEMSKPEIDFYLSLFQSIDIILLRESTLQNESFPTLLEHERMHKNIVHNTLEDYKKLKKAAQEIMSRRDKDGIPLVTERVSRDNFRVVAAQMNWTEFYTYMAGNEFGLEAEEMLKNDYPEAHQLYITMKEKSKIKK